MRSSRLLIIFLFLSPFILSFSFFKSKPRDYSEIAREIRSTVGKKLAKKHKMDLIGVGGGMMKSVYMIGLSFQIHHPLNRKKGRELIVDCVEELLTAINENEEIRPFLKNYPFTTKNVQIAIYVNDDNKREVFDPDFRVVSVFESDHISFSTVDRTNSMKYKNQYHEPYDKALAIVKGDRRAH
jgi:hypothetical protein